MNEEIVNRLKNDINKYESYATYNTNSNAAIFHIMNTYFSGLIYKNTDIDENGVKVICTTTKNSIGVQVTDIVSASSSNNGFGIVFEFDNELYSIRFTKYYENTNLYHVISIESKNMVKYTGSFIYNYILHSALKVSNLKGSYFTMPRNQFSWDIKEIEKRGFGDIFLPKEIMDDLHLFVDIFKDSNKLLRYLKVGNPGVGKTESTIIIANELNKLGVTIIKTPICDYLHEKVELANLLAPSLLIFDDIDLYLGSRNTGGYSTKLGDFLDVLDGTDKLADNVGIIATTNAAHLLDLAAQRPGRFDKTLLFDDITKDNIINIIKKSLKINFNLTKIKDINVFITNEVINTFYDAGVSGSHIFNSIKMLKLRYDTLRVKNITSDDIVKSLKVEMKVIKKIRETTELNSKYDRRSGKKNMGFNNHDEDYDEDYDDDYDDIEVEEPLRKIGFN